MQQSRIVDASKTLIIAPAWRDMHSEVVSSRVGQEFVFDRRSSWTADPVE